MAKGTKPGAPAKKDALDQLAEGGAEGVIALMLWQARKRNPDMYVQITEVDIKGFTDCTRYLKVVPEVQIFRPQGIPAQPAIPAAGSRRAVPAREAQPPKPYVMVRLVEKGTSNGIRPVENNEEDYDAQQQRARVMAAKDKAAGLAHRLIQQANSGEYSLSDMSDAAQALVTLAEAV